MLTYLLYALLAWLLYKFIFGFVIPVYKTTRQVKKAFRQMHEHMQESQMNQQSYNQSSPSQKSSSKPSGNDYIDFEEIN